MDSRSLTFFCSQSFGVVLEFKGVSFIKAALETATTAQPQTLLSASLLISDQVCQFCPTVSWAEWGGGADAVPSTEQTWFELTTKAERPVYHQ